MLVWGWLSGPVSFQLMPSSSSIPGSLSPRLSPRPARAPLFLSRSAGLPPSQSERVTHAQCCLAVLAGHPWPASVWRPWHLWFSEQSWRPRGTLGPSVLWRFRWQLWNQPSGRPLGPWRQWKAIQPGDQCSGKGTTPSLPPATSLPPLESMCSFESFLIPHSVSPSLQGAVAQPGYGSVQGSNNANAEVRGRVWGRRGVRCVGQDVGRQRGKKDGRGGDLRLEAVWTEKSWKCEPGLGETCWEREPILGKHESLPVGFDPSLETHPPLPSAVHQPPAIRLRWKLEQLWGKRTGRPEAPSLAGRKRRNSAPFRQGGKYT